MLIVFSLFYKVVYYVINQILQDTPKYKKSNPEEHYHNQFDMSDILPSTIQGVK